MISDEKPDIFVAFHHFAGGWEDDWGRVEVADVPAVGSHLGRFLFEQI